MAPPTESHLSRRKALYLGMGVALTGGLSGRPGFEAGEERVATANEGAVRRGIASGASRVILPEGSIVLGCPLMIPSGVSLIGAGAGRTRFLAGPTIGSGQAMLEGAGRGIVLADFSLDGRARGGAGAGHGVQLTGSGHQLSRLHVRDVAQAGYRLSISSSEVEDCLATNCGRSGHTDNHGFMLFTTARDNLVAVRYVHFRRCRVDNAFRKGFAVYSDGPAVSDILFEACQARDSGLATESGGGFYIVPVSPGRVSQVALQNCLADGNYVNYEIGPVSGLVVSGCRSRAAQATGFLFHGLRNLEITRNRDDGSGVDSMRFDNVLGTSIGGRVAENELTNANRSAAGFASYINLEGAERIVVTDNVFGDEDGRSPFGIYEGSGAGRNDIRANRQIGRR